MILERTWQFLNGLHRWVWILFCIVTLIVYTVTLSPGAVGGDPGELQFVPAILSSPHPTGTPLYVLLGKIWSLLPLGPTVAWRMNLLAAVSATLAALIVYHCIYMRFAHPVPALAAALSLAFGLTFWEQAVLADKYAFNALMVALIVYFTLRWGKTRSPRILNLLALTYGFSLTHHRTMSLFAPTLLGYVWWHERGQLWRNRRRLIHLALLCLAPTVLYLYLPWAQARNLPPGTWHPHTMRQWYDYLFDTGRTGMVYVDPNDLGEMLLFYARTLLRDFTWVGVVLGLGGIAVQFRKRPADAVMLLFNYVLQAFLAANHHVPRHWVYFIPSFLIWALWVGEALAQLLHHFRARVLGFRLFGRSVGRYLAFTALFLFLLWPLARVPKRYRPLRASHLGFGTLDVWRQTLKTGHMADRVGKSIVSVEPDAIIVCDWEQATPLWYYQQVEGLRLDVQIVYPIERLDEVAVLGNPLYIARTLPGVAERWYPSCSAAIVALRDEPWFDLPTAVSTSGVTFGNVIELAGFAYGATGFYPTQVVPLTLYWRALDVPAHDYSVSLRVLDETGSDVYKVDSQHPVLGMYPTTQWQIGQVVADYYEIQLSPQLSPGKYRWGVILYRALPEGGWESLKVDDTDETFGLGDTIEVTERN
jgi:hypothetical protein